MFKLAISEGASYVAEELWARWLADRSEIVAPRLLYFELTSTLRNKVHRGILPADEAESALQHLLRMRVSLVQPSDLHMAAWKLASRFNRPNAYDANYLAVAEALDCPLWTADRRLYNAVKEDFPSINLVG